jgi:hypothetical protein
MLLGRGWGEEVRAEIEGILDFFFGEPWPEVGITMDDYCSESSVS